MPWRAVCGLPAMAFFCKKGTAAHPQVFRCPEQYRFIPDDASGRIFCSPSTSRPTAGLRAQGRPGFSER